MRRLATYVTIGALGALSFGVLATVVPAGAGGGPRTVQGVIDPDPVVIGEAAEAFPASEDDLCFEVKDASAAGFNPEQYQLVWSTERADTPGESVEKGSEDMTMTG